VRETLAFHIATGSGGITFGGFAVAALLLAAVQTYRNGQKPVDPLGALFGTAVLAGVPCALAFFASLLASALLIALQTPPLAFLFVGLAAALSFAHSLNKPSYGMEGCTKLFAIVWSAYAAVWSAVSFWMLGGVAAIGWDAASLAWLRPLLVAAPYAAALARLTDKKRRTAGKFVGALIFITAFFAILFLPVEAGLAGRWLPDSDWLRFPIIALAAALVAATVPVLLSMWGSSNARRRRIRELPRRIGLFSLVLLPAGFLWAASRALTGALV